MQGKENKLNRTVSDILFHFTGLDKKRENFKPDDKALNDLLSILENNEFLLNPNKREWIYPSLSTGNYRNDYMIPMLCFTETPLEFLSDHMGTFGEFGIGMKIEWGEKNGAQNLIYCDNNFPNYYSLIATKLSAFILKYKHTIPEVDWDWTSLLAGASEEYIHRNEREWRIIGEFNQDRTAIIPPSVKFKPEDISCVVCPQQYIETLEHSLDCFPQYDNFPFEIHSSDEIKKKNKS